MLELQFALIASSDEYHKTKLFLHLDDNNKIRVVGLNNLMNDANDLVKKIEMIAKRTLNRNNSIPIENRKKVETNLNEVVDMKKKLLCYEGIALIQDSSNEYSELWEAIDEKGSIRESMILRMGNMKSEYSDCRTFSKALHIAKTVMN